MSEEIRAPLLYDDLNMEDRLYLANLQQQPGYKVLIKVFNAACARATRDVISLDPMAENYSRKLSALQQMSRAMNEFCAAVCKSVQWHSLKGLAEQREEQEVEELVERAKE
jgi:hypothetical protein